MSIDLMTSLEMLDTSHLIDVLLPGWWLWRFILGSFTLLGSFALFGSLALLGCISLGSISFGSITASWWGSELSWWISLGGRGSSYELLGGFCSKWTSGTDEIFIREGRLGQNLLRVIHEING
jgi:hypothetical protein